MTDYVKELLAINPSYDPDLLEKAAISPKEHEFVKNYLANRDEQ